MDAKLLIAVGEDQVSRHSAFLRSGLPRSGSDEVNSVHLTKTSGCSPTAQPFCHLLRLKLVLLVVVPSGHTWGQAAAALWEPTSLLLSPSYCGWEANTLAPAMPEPSLLSVCWDLGFLSLPLLCNAPSWPPQKPYKQFSVTFSPASSSWPSWGLWCWWAHSTPLICLTPYSRLSTLNRPYLPIPLHSFDCPQGSLFPILWKIIHIQNFHLELDLGFPTTVSGLCFNSLFLTCSGEDWNPALNSHGRSQSWWRPSPGTAPYRNIPGHPDFPLSLSSTLSRST